MAPSKTAKERYTSAKKSMWHGASWNYILWGLYFLVFLLLEKFIIRGRLPRVLSHVYALVVIYLGWVLFKFENFAELGGVLAGMFGLAGGGFANMAVATLFMQNIFLMLFCFVACTNLGKWLHHRFFEAAKGNQTIATIYAITEAATPIILFIVAVAALAGASYNPFIYFQF